jgi:hypothetical protein
MAFTDIWTQRKSERLKIRFSMNYLGVIAQADLSEFLTKSVYILAI